MEKVFGPLPDGFKAQTVSMLGEDEAALLFEALECAPSVGVRANRAKGFGREALFSHFAHYDPEPVEWCESGVRLGSRPDFVHDPLLHAGVFYVQEAASMVYESIVGQLVEDMEGEVRVLDMCAAPGGKSTAILNGLYGRRHLLVANEFDRSRSAILRENLDKWGDPDVVVTNSPSEVFSRMEDWFDIVAVDAPCSGEGMMRREPVARSQWSERLVDSCGALQREILSSAVVALRPGGTLIYSTCTFNEVENEANTCWLADKFGLSMVKNPRRFYPHREGCEGLCVAVMRKPGAQESHELTRGGMEQLLKLLRQAKANVIRVGTEQTVRKGNLEIPSSRSVLASDYERDKFPEVELDAGDALAYLKGNALTLPEVTPKGYVAVCYGGYPLGLVKNLGNRANNLYPSEWRIRK